MFSEPERRQVSYILTDIARLMVMAQLTRRLTVSPGYGTAGTVVNLILGAFPGATAEAISYPACGGQSSCGGVQYVVLCVNPASTGIVD